MSREDKKFSLVKDVLCMANTPRDCDAYIVLGVEKHPDGKTDLLGLNSHEDEAKLQSQFTERVHPIPSFRYEIVSYQEKSFGIIVIPPEKRGPCVPVKDYGGSQRNQVSFLRQRQIYFRRGSKNDLAAPEDVIRISNWISSDSIADNSPQQAQSVSPDWDSFLGSVHNFSASHKYILVSNVSKSNEAELLGKLGMTNWSFVIDLDPESDQEGLLSAVRPILESHRNVHLMVKGDRPTLNLDRGTYWFFARGLAGSGETSEMSTWVDWLREYGNELKEQIANVVKASAPTPVTVVALWYREGMADHLQSIFGDILSSYGDSADFVIVTDNPADVHPVSARMDCNMLAIPLYHLCSGIELLFANPSDEDSDVVILPSSSGTPISLDPSAVNWIEEEIELVHLNAGGVDDDNRDTGIDFLKGNEITWYELGLRYDVERDQTQRLLRQVERDLSNRPAVRLNLYHEPGAGGTTVAKRIVWDLHRLYPCGILRRTEPRETIERLQYIVTLTGQPALVIADGGDVSGRELDELFEYVKARHLSVVILQVLRRFQSQESRERTTYLARELSTAECQRFAHILSREAPEQTATLDRVVNQPNRFRTPFYYCLQAFGENFVGLQSYVSSRLVELTDVQKRILGTLAIAHHYGQKSVPAQAFGSMLGIPANRRVNLTEALSGRGLDLSVESSRGEWRTSHDLIATEALRQLLWPSHGDRSNWSQNLSAWAIEFAHFCRGDSPLPSNSMLEIARRTFVYRDNVELLGTERAATRQFAQLLGDIPVKEGRLAVLRSVAEAFPDEAHFWAHLGRFYAIEMKDFSISIECIDKAIGLRPDDSVLHHMKGMGLRSHAIEMIEQRSDISDVVAMAKQASDSFEAARQKNPDDEHGYISEVQLISRLLDYSGTHHSNGLKGYLSAPTIDPFIRGGLERCEDLLEQVRRNREGDGPSQYEQECRGRLDSFYGRHDQALQVWDNLLQRRDVYLPPVRRQIVWTYLARRGRAWDHLSSRELDRAAMLLEENLNEDPNNDRDMRMWVQAVRRISYPPSIESVIEKVAYWQANTGSIDATYYLYVFNAVLALEGFSFASDSAHQYLEECRNKARLRRNRTKSFEWLGPADAGLSKLVHHSRLGDWDSSSDFWTNIGPLTRLSGRISRVQGSEAGHIEVPGGMLAFFVPAKGGFYRGRSENQAVEFYLGFSYDGLRAWDVRPV